MRIAFIEEESRVKPKALPRRNKTLTFPVGCNRSWAGIQITCTMLIGYSNRSTLCRHRCVYGVETYQFLLSPVCGRLQYVFTVGRGIYDSLYPANTVF